MELVSVLVYLNMLWVSRWNDVKHYVQQEEISEEMSLDTCPIKALSSYKLYIY
jgi:hypothetical protein